MGKRAHAPSRAPALNTRVRAYIGVPYTNGNPCNNKFRELGDVIAAEVEAQGGKPIFAMTPVISDGLTNGSKGMRSVPKRAATLHPAATGTGTGTGTGAGASVRDVGAPGIAPAAQRWPRRPCVLPWKRLLGSATAARVLTANRGVRWLCFLVACLVSGVS